MRRLCTAAAGRSSAGYAAPMTEEPRPDLDEQVAELRRQLEAEIDRQMGPQRGCWPLLVAVAGVLLGLLLLSGVL